MRTSSSSKVKDWIAAINDAVQKPSEGWCHPHRFGSFAPPRKWVDGSEAQWFIDGESAFDAIAAAIENANTEVCSLHQVELKLMVLYKYITNVWNSVQIFITGWWLCPELYLRRPFTNHKTSRLDILLESKAKEGVHVRNKTFLLLVKEISGKGRD